MSKRRWTPEEEVKAADMEREGFTDAEIGAMIGRTRRSVSLHRCHTNGGLSPNAARAKQRNAQHLRTRDVYDIRAMHDAGVEPKWLAKRFDISLSAVSYIVNRRVYRNL